MVLVWKPSKPTRPAMPSNSSKAPRKNAVDKIAGGKTAGAKKAKAESAGDQHNKDKGMRAAPSPGTKTSLLRTGGNPQIPKGKGNGPVQAYIGAMPGWKQEIGRHLDALIERIVPDVQKAVKWNTPFYGRDDQGWFLGFHCLARYVKVAFFRGTSLQPMPPGSSKQDDVRYLDIHEHDVLDDTQLARWIEQASRLPGKRL